MDYAAAGHWSGALVDDGLRAGAENAPEAPAVVDRGRRVTYGELDRLADRGAALLWRLGVRPGDVVSFQLPNWLEAAVLYHATARVGAISNPIVPIYRHREVGFILGQARTRVFVVPSRFRGFDYPNMAEELRADLPELEHVLVVDPEGGGSFGEALAAEDDDAPPPPPAPAVARTSRDPVLLLYTSGTESRPKGVLHTHDTLGYECRSVAALYGLTADDVVFMPSPVTHITGLLYGLQLPFLLGARVVLLDTWGVEAALELIERERCTFTVGATPFLHGLVNAPEPDRLATMRLFVCGGADIPPALIRAAAERTPMLATRVYGSTECPIATGTAPDRPLRLHAETDGAPIAPTEVRVVDDEDRPQAPPAIGNLQVRGPDLTIGYRDPALNAVAFTADGWFRTGDLAEIDADGRLRIAGRVKDIIVRGGENLSAKEIENLLFEHPDVEEVAVVAFPDPVLGERACAYVVGAEHLTLEAVVAFLRTRGVANQKLPERLRLVDALPKTASGKVQKFVLRDAERKATA